MTAKTFSGHRIKKKTCRGSLKIHTVETTVSSAKFKTSQVLPQERIFQKPPSLKEHRILAFVVLEHPLWLAYANPERYEVANFA